MFNNKKILLLWCCCFFIALQTEAQVKFIWPLQQANGFDDPSYYSIGNYMDHDTTKNVVRDYNGGYRTYDGHLGFDINLYPDPWLKKRAGQVNVVAAAAGQIIKRYDGYPDDNCSMGSDTSNLIRLRHADGTKTYYKHLKKNSVTSKQVHDWVAEGEYLGKVASSGSSTGPHLHFDVVDANGKVIDPFVGPFNPTTNVSLWKNQVPYYDGGVNKVYIGSDFVTPPTPSCLQLWNRYAKNVFKPGQTVYTTTCVRTPAPLAQVYIYVIRPNGTIHNNNSLLHQFPLELISKKGKTRKKELYKSYNLPFNAQIGTWTIVVTYNNLLLNADIVTFEVEPWGGFTLNFKPIKNNGLRISTTEPLPKNTKKVLLQRSYDGENWTTIDQEIDPTDIANWEYEDIESQLSETIYYRINSFNEDGEEKKGTVFYWDEKATKASTGLLEVSNLSVDLYPNPTRGSLQLVTTDVSANKTVEIVSIAGQVLGTFDWEKGSNVLKLQVDYLPAGVYSAHVIEKGRKVVKPFVKSE